MQRLRRCLNEPLRAQQRLVFKYTCAVRLLMLAQRRTVIILAILLLTPLSSAIDNPVETKVNEREIAALNWHEIQPLQTSHSSLKSLDYSIHLESASFDPLTEDLPNSRLDDINDYRSTGMAIVQLKHHTGAALYDLVDEYGLFILDNLGASNWLVRLSHPSDLGKLQGDESVRWAGPMMPGWRVSESVDKSTDFISCLLYTSPSPRDS